MTVILIARAYPPLGSVYLLPQITATWITVLFVFFLAGLGIKTDELKNVFKRFFFNVFVQIYNFFIVSAIVYGFSLVMIIIGALSKSLADGMIICSCLPVTINMVVVLTKSAGGDEGSAVFHAAFGNMIGVFLSPALIYWYIGITTEIDLLSVFIKLATRVLFPIFVGQVLVNKVKFVNKFVRKYKKFFVKAQIYALVFLVYTVFCKTFSKGSSSSIADIFLMIFFQFILLFVVMILSWFLLRLLFRDEPKLRVMGFFGCTLKTVAMGIPLIDAMFENDPNVGLYTLPLLIWHPMQLIIGTLLVPRLNVFVNSEKERLGIEDDIKDSKSVSNATTKSINDDLEQMIAQ